jgi:hypothetical protein
VFDIGDKVAWKSGRKIFCGEVLEVLANHAVVVVTGAMRDKDLGQRWMVSPTSLQPQS